MAEGAPAGGDGSGQGAVPPPGRGRAPAPDSAGGSRDAFVPGAAGRGHSLIRGTLTWLAVAALASGVLWFFRGHVDKVHMALGYLLVVLGGSAREGRAVGVVLSVVCFLAFNFFLLPPFYTLAIHEPLDWWVLLAFLITGMVAAELFYRTQRTVALAERVEALREADRLKDALLATVSHDLRTPLTSIRALAAELRETGDERAAIIEEEAIRLNRMVTDLLDLSLIRAGALPVSPEVNAAEDLVGAALAQLQALEGGEAIQVTLPPDGSLALGRFDFVHALRALTNLLENALRHSPPGQPVELEVILEGAYLVFRVMDRGPGVPPRDQERIFEPFSRTGAEAKARGRTGAGLGLAIAKRVAEAQGGTVGYDPRPGGGSTFELRLPSAEVPEAS
jgi:K+-sensing histidine kinase KdpD